MAPPWSGIMHALTLPPATAQTQPHWDLGAHEQKACAIAYNLINKCCFSLANSGATCTHRSRYPTPPMTNGARSNREAGLNIMHYAGPRGSHLGYIPSWSATTPTGLQPCLLPYGVVVPEFQLNCISCISVQWRCFTLYND